MDYKCLAPGSTWQIDARLKLLEADSEIGALCSRVQTSSSVDCPSVVVRIYDKPDPATASVKILDEDVWDYVDPEWKSDDFNDFRGTFTVPSSYTEIDSVQLIIRDFNASLDVVIDNFSIIPAAA